MSDKIKLDDLLEQWSNQMGWKYNKNTMDRLLLSLVQVLLNQMKYNDEGKVFIRDVGTFKLRKHKFFDKSFKCMNLYTNEQMIAYGKAIYTGIDFIASSVLLDSINNKDFTYERSKTNTKKYTKEEQRVKNNVNRRKTQKRKEDVMVDIINEMKRALREEEENGET